MSDNEQMEARRYRAISAAQLDWQETGDFDASFHFPAGSFEHAQYWAEAERLMAMEDSHD